MSRCRAQPGAEGGNWAQGAPEVQRNHRGSLVGERHGAPKENGSLQSRYGWVVRGGKWRFETPWCRARYGEVVQGDRFKVQGVWFGLRHGGGGSGGG